MRRKKKKDDSLDDLIQKAGGEEAFWKKLETDAAPHLPEEEWEKYVRELARDPSVLTGD